MSTLATSDVALPEIVRLQLELHRQFQSGQSTGPHADEIRGQMEHFWWQLSERDQSLIEGLSADLFTIGAAREMILASSPLDQMDLKSAVDGRDWQKVLDLVRDHESLIPPSTAAYVRAVAWMQMRFPAVAAEFYQEVVRLEKPRPVQELADVFSGISSFGVASALPVVSP